MQRNIPETIAYMVDQLINKRLKNAPFNKSYSGVISELLFEPDTPRDSSQFGTYKIRYGTSETVVKLNDSFVHEIGERVKVTLFENNPNHIVVKPVIRNIPPYKIAYDSKENKYIEYRRVKTGGKIYETTDEYKILSEKNNNGSQEIEFTEIKLPNSQTIKFKEGDI